MRDLPLAVAPDEGEPAEALQASLVRRDGEKRDRAVLYVHGWNDYFFHAHVAEHFAALGYSFYALDLRRCGRSARPGHMAGYITDLDDYEVEFDLAASILLAEHRELVVMGHSTGGLSVALWADRNPGLLSALILNSPWLDMQGSWVVRSLAAPLVSQIGVRAPSAVLPLPEVNLYAKSLHAKYGGQWNYDFRLKPEAHVPIRAGWMSAVLHGHERVAAGLHIDCPVLVLASTRSDFRVRWDPAMRRADTVLDVTQIAARAVRLGEVVTVVRIPGAMHDVTLSEPPVRKRLWHEVDRWLTAYGPVGAAS
ncbi:alpha/beta hydrolase [Propionicicella superfundia]|uniref:alpha/beta hydrolase n=1 Tax=Propionicicella superfundia TaxID=348582 RepID=UPI001FE1BE5A|nr:alpha/beta hydrolase [Propionicicella superfundia]